MEVPEHKEIRELARRFLSERGGALRAYEEEEAFPWPLVEEMAELGFLGVFVPEALGSGAGLLRLPRPPGGDGGGPPCAPSSRCSRAWSSPPPRLRHGGAKGPLRAPPRPAGDPRGLRPHRARGRLGRGKPQDPRPPGGGLLRPGGAEDLHLPRQRGRGLPRLRQDRPGERGQGDHLLPRGAGRRG